MPQAAAATAAAVQPPLPPPPPAGRLGHRIASTPCAPADAADRAASTPVGTEGGAARAVASRVQGVLMALVLAFALYQGVAAVMGPAARQRLSAAWDMPSFLVGRTAAAVNYVMAHYLPADETLRAAGGVLRWGVFGSGGPQVWAGCDGWLYLTEELRPWPDGEAMLRRRGEAIGRVAALLRERGAGLLVAVVPDKARIERAHLCGADPRSAQAEARLGAATSMLSGLGVPIVDLAAAFVEARRGGASDHPLYYRTDTHWNQQGAALAARAIADAADRAAPIPLDRSHPFETTRAAVQTPLVGDLLRLMGLDTVPDALRPAPDQQAVERTAEATIPTPAAGARAQADAAAGQDSSGGGLLDDGPVTEIILLGSSFSLNANFHGRLQEALRATVGNFAQAGGAFAGAARAYLEGEAFRETPPKLVIWEMPERVLTQPLDAADKALLGAQPDMR